MNELRLHLATAQEVAAQKQKEKLTHQLIEARCDGHGDGQMHTIADVKAGIVNDLIEGVYLSNTECAALYNWLKNEFIPHDNYDILTNVMKKINVKLAG